MSSAKHDSIPATLCELRYATIWRTVSLLRSSTSVRAAVSWLTVAFGTLYPLRRTQCLCFRIPRQGDHTRTQSNVNQVTFSRGCGPECWGKRAVLGGEEE